MLIGLDGVPLNLIEKFKSELPTFNKLLKYYGNLSSVIPAHSPPAWVSIFTGLDPGQHGIFDFFRKKGYKDQLMTSKNITSKTIWDYLKEKKLKSNLIQVPYTYPVKPINGNLIAGTPATYLSENIFYPEKLKQKILKKMPDYKIGVEWQNLNNENQDAFLKDLHQLTENITNATILLMKEKWDFSMIVFEDFDRILHFHWLYMDESHPLHNLNKQKSKKYKNSIKNYFKLLDTSLKKILEKTDERTLIILVSDHGFMPVSKQVRINTVLEKLNLLTKTKQEKPNLKEKIKEKIVSITYKFGFYNIFKILPRKTKTILRKNLIKEETKEETKIIWEKTKAYFDSYAGQGIRINLREREPGGTVDKKDYKKIRDKIIQELKNLKYQGRQVVKNVYKREEVFSKKFLDQAPDIMFELNKGFTAKAGFSEELFEIPRVGKAIKSADHSREGFFSFYGKDIKIKQTNAKSIDIVPTILNIFKIKKPKEMKGKVLDILD